MQFQKQNIFANLFSEWHQSAHLLDTPKTCWLSQTLIAQMMDYFSKTLAGGVVYKREELEGKQNSSMLTIRLVKYEETTQLIFNQEKLKKIRDLM